MKVKKQQTKPTPHINKPLNIPQLHPQGQMRIKTTAELLDIHHQTLRRWWKAGTFPKPININGILLFRNADILEWLEAQHSQTEGA